MVRLSFKSFLILMIKSSVYFVISGGIDNRTWSSRIFGEFVIGSNVYYKENSNSYTIYKVSV